jgi:hypothetical protein
MKIYNCLRGPIFFTKAKNMNPKHPAPSIVLTGILVLFGVVALRAQDMMPPIMGPNGPENMQTPNTPYAPPQNQGAPAAPAPQPSTDNTTRASQWGSPAQNLQMGGISGSGLSLLSATPRSGWSGSRRPGIIRYSLHAGSRPARSAAAPVDATASPQANGVAGVTDNAPNEYIIKRYDTLWDLARSFLGNPYDWQKIWSWNQYIQNPNLIYPGQQLSIQGYKASGISPAASAVSGSAPRRSFAEVTNGFLDNTGTTPATAASTDTSLGTFGDVSSIASFVTKNMLTAEFLEQVPFLWMQKDSRGLLYPGDSRIDPQSERPSFQQFDEATVKILGSASYVVGDTIDVYRSIRMVSLGKVPANLVQRIAHGRVTEVKAKAFKITLFKVWDVVKAGDRVAHMLRGEQQLVIGDYLDPPAALHAAVFERVEDSPLPYPFQTFIIDQGQAEGIQRGDLFYTYPTKASEASTMPVILACAAYTGDHFATLAIVKQSGTELKPGDAVKLVKRVQYN